MTLSAEQISERHRRRFWRRVFIRGRADCWPWTGAVNSGGYGSFLFNGKVQTASRVLHQIAIGPIPPGLFVLHHCDVPLCMNPAHIYAGTHQQNMRDKMERKRARGGVGERNAKAKLTTRRVITIRASKERTTALAKRFNVDRCTIQRIRSNKIWRHV